MSSSSSLMAGRWSCSNFLSVLQVKGVTTTCRFRGPYQWRCKKGSYCCIMLYICFGFLCPDYDYSSCPLQWEPECSKVCFHTRYMTHWPEGAYGGFVYDTSTVNASQVSRLGSLMQSSPRFRCGFSRALIPALLACCALGRKDH